MMQGQLPSPLIATSIGWGVRNQLHSLSVLYMPNDVCRLELGIWNVFVHDQTLCTIAPPGNIICDPGNPLVANGQLIGVQSWEPWEPSCISGLPSMHERISHNRLWIDSVIR